MIVNEGSITSSPGPIPNASTATSNAAVPLDTAIACLRFTRIANFASNCFTKGPSEEIHPECYERVLQEQSGRQFRYGFAVQ